MTDEAKALVERRYLLVKRGLYYAPDRQGYTGVKARAGRYREVDALGLDGVTAIHEDEAPDFAPACWEETKLAHLNGIIETQAREIERLRVALRVYAGPMEWTQEGGWGDFPVWADGYPGGVYVDDNTLDYGDAARAALGEKQ